MNYDLVFYFKQGVEKIKIWVIQTFCIHDYQPSVWYDTDTMKVGKKPILKDAIVKNVARLKLWKLVFHYIDIG